MLGLPKVYLSKLDYVDLRNLSRTCKELKIIRQNKTLRDIIAYRTNMILPSNANLSVIMRELDDKLMSLIQYHYSNLPRWVNRELFYIDFRKDLHKLLIENLSEKLEDLNIPKQRFSMMICIILIKVLLLN